MSEREYVLIAGVAMFVLGSTLYAIGTYLPAIRARRAERAARRRLDEFRRNPTVGTVVGYELPRSGGVWMLGRITLVADDKQEVEVGTPYDDGRWGYQMAYVDDIDAVFPPDTVLGRHETRPV